MEGGGWLIAAIAALALAAAAFLAGRRSAAGREETRGPAAFASLAAPLAPMIQALPEPVLLLDADGRVVLRNQAAADLTGATEGKPLAAAFRVPDVHQAVERVLAGGPLEQVEFTQPVPVERTIGGYVGGLDLGGVRHVLVLLRDITQIVRVERMRADFVANASHELRTPLASLSGFIETIRGPARDDYDAQARFLEIMQAQADRMRRLIDDLLSLSRIELNEHVHPLGKAHLAAIVRDVIDAAQPQLAREGVKVINDTAAGEALVVGDRDELIQVVQNLLDNAVKYAGEGGDVTIAIQPAQNGLIACTVSDKGPGIAREHIPRLTERFYRVDAKTSRERGGTGLGLAIVKHIVNRHRGRLEIDSEPGKGSRFTFLVPAWPAEPAAFKKLS